MKHTQSGFTAIEILLVIVIVGVLTAIIAVPLGTFRKQQALQNTTNSIVAQLQDARARTLAATNNTFYSVRIESHRAILFDGSTYSASDTGNEIYSFQTPSAASATLAGGGSQITFDRLKGTTSQYGTIVIAIPDQSRTVTISSTGTIMRN